MEALNLKFDPFFFKVYSNSESRNCVLAFFNEQSYNQIEKQLNNESMPRNERIQIMESYSKMPLCNTGAFENHILIECQFKLEGNGTLVFFPEATKYGEYIIISHYFLSTTLQETISSCLEMFTLIIFFSFVPIVVFICMVNHFDLKYIEKRKNGSVLDTYAGVLGHNDNNHDDRIEPELGFQDENQRNDDMQRLREQYNRNYEIFRDLMMTFRNNRNNIINNKNSSATVSL